MTKPFRLELHSECGVPLQLLNENAKTVVEARIPKSKPHGKKLAIVAGGNSVKNHLDELRQWNGDIWSVNSTGAWLLKQGIKSIFVSVDPSNPDKFNTEGMEEAIIATCCHPELRNKFKKCQFFDLIEQAEDGIIGGTTTASRMPFQALNMGYCNISLFGCDSSFDINSSDHVDRDTGSKELVIIKSDGAEYVTILQFLLQAEHLSDLIRLAPDVFINRSSGLIDVFLNDQEGWEVVAVSELLKDNIEKYSGKHGRFETSYQVA